MFARQADVVIGIGTRYSDFTTASKTIWQHPDVKFVNINVAGMDAVKLAGLPVVADAKRALPALTERWPGTRPAPSTRRATARAKAWDDEVVASHP